MPARTKASTLTLKETKRTKVKIYSLLKSIPLSKCTRATVQRLVRPTTSKDVLWNKPYVPTQIKVQGYRGSSFLQSWALGTKHTLSYPSVRTFIELFLSKPPCCCFFFRIWICWRHLCYSIRFNLPTQI